MNKNEITTIGSKSLDSKSTIDRLHSGELTPLLKKYLH